MFGIIEYYFVTDNGQVLFQSKIAGKWIFHLNFTVRIQQPGSHTSYYFHDET